MSKLLQIYMLKQAQTVGLWLFRVSVVVDSDVCSSECVNTNVHIHDRKAELSGLTILRVELLKDAPLSGGSKVFCLLHFFSLHQQKIICFWR